MKKIITSVITITLILSLAVMPVLAAGHRRRQNAAAPKQQSSQPMTEVRANFTDNNNDGVCDNAGVCDNTGNRYGRRCRGGRCK